MPDSIDSLVHLLSK